MHNGNLLLALMVTAPALRTIQAGSRWIILESTN